MEDKPDFEELAAEALEDVNFVVEGEMFRAMEQVKCQLAHVWTSHVLPLKKEFDNYIQFTNEEIEKFREAYRKECVNTTALKKENERLKALSLPDAPKG